VAVGDQGVETLVLDFPASMARLPNGPGACLLRRKGGDPKPVARDPLSLDPLGFLGAHDTNATLDAVPGREAFRVPPSVFVSSLFHFYGIDQGAHAAGVL